MYVNLSMGWDDDIQGQHFDNNSTVTGLNNINRESEVSEHCKHHH